MTFTPCSKRHKSCSPAHADLVNSYRDERHRQEVVHEYLYHNGEHEHWKAMGGKLIDFKDWLKAHKRTDRP